MGKAASKLKSWARAGLLYSLVFVLVSFIGNLWFSRNQVSGPAPDITAQSLENGNRETINISGFKRPVLVYFFADWCPICKVQHDTIQSINEYYPVIAVAMQSGGIEDVREYVKQEKLDLLVLNDESGQLSAKFGVNGVPASFIIDSNNAIRFSTRGYVTTVGLLGRLWLAEVF